MDKCGICLVGTVSFIFLLVLSVLLHNSNVSIATPVQKSTEVFHTCNCSRWEGGVDLLRFKLGRHTALINGVKSFQSSARIVSGSAVENLSYSHDDLEVLETFLDQCFGGQDAACKSTVKTQYNVTKANMYSEDCQYYINVKRLLTLCFGINRDLNRGFVNQTVFSVDELKQLYNIIKYFALEPWIEVERFLSDHYPYRVPQGYDDG